MEPHWNPSVEQQALARIYRMGQKRKVTTIRYIMRNSFEDVRIRRPACEKKEQHANQRQHVVNIQDRKKTLMDVLLSNENVDASNHIERLRVSYFRCRNGDFTELTYVM
jgi:hypothetical protein